MIGRPDVKRLHVVQELGGLLFSERIPGHADRRRSLENVVVDVGHVFDGQRAVAQEFQVSRQHVEANVSEGMAQVGRVVWRHAAHVHSEQAVVSSSKLAKSTLPPFSGVRVTCSTALSLWKIRCSAQSSTGLKSASGGQNAFLIFLR